MMSYQVHPIRDRFGAIVGYLDAQYVLNRDRRVIAEVRSGTVLRFDGRVCGEYDGTHFLDRTRAVVATLQAGMEHPRFLGAVRGRRAALAVLRVRPAAVVSYWDSEPATAVRWSRIDWRHYIEM